MGILDKLKNNFSHGGVKVSLETPESINAGDSNLIVRVTLSSENKISKINKINVKLVQIIDRAVSGTGQNSGYESPSHEERWMAGADYTNSFEVQPGQPLMLDLNLPLNLTSFWGSDSDNPLVQAGAEFEERLERITNFMERERFRYEVVCGVDVEGVSMVFDPGARKKIEILHIDTTRQ